MNAKKEPDAKTIKASTDLQRKVGTGNVEVAQVEKAQKVIETNVVDFGELANPQLKELRQAIVMAQKNKHGGPDDRAILEAIILPIMNLKANAGNFNFPLISEMTGVVLNFLENVKVMDDNIVHIADNLHKAVSVAVTMKLKTSKNGVGQQLLTEFDAVCKRYAAKYLKE